MRPAAGVAALVAGAVVGVLAGFGAHAVAPLPGGLATPPSSSPAGRTGSPTSSPGSPTATPGSPTSATESPRTTFLGDANVFRTTDLSAVGWRPEDVKEATAEGDAQAALVCQKQAISQAGSGINAMMNGYWSHTGASAIQDESIDEVVAQFGTVAQAKAMSTTIQGWFADCTNPESDGGAAGPARHIVSADSGILWWRVKVGDGKIVHEGLVRGANRVALVAAYSPPTTDAQFIALMRKAAQRLLG